MILNNGQGRSFRDFLEIMYIKEWVLGTEVPRLTGSMLLLEGIRICVVSLEENISIEVKFCAKWVFIALIS
jgi:hypothetical protein